MDNNKLVKINNTDLSVRELNGQRVITLKDIDALHKRPDGTARRNFNENKKHLIADEDYFVRNSYEAKKEFGITAPNGLKLITESGYLMLVKSLQDDLAWKVQRELVNNYFRVKEDRTKLSNDVIISALKNILEEHEVMKKELKEKTALINQINNCISNATFPVKQKVEMSENAFRNLIVEFINENDVVLKSHKQGLAIDKDALYKYMAQYGWTQHDVLKTLDEYHMIYHSGEDKTQRLRLDGKIIRTLIIQ